MGKALLGIVADDITGSSDIGVLIAKWNYTVKIFSYDTIDDLYDVDSDVIIIDTNSRFDKKNDAYEKARKATRKLKELGCTQFYNKTCSVFRGNIGVEFDAMQDELGINSSIVVLGYPETGRTTMNSIHYVYGEPLSKSMFRNDPIHPMQQDNLIDILQEQTVKRVGAISNTLIRKGTDILKREIESMKNDYNYVILDVESDESLETIADAIKNFPIICGSAVMGKYLPKYWPRKEKIDHLKGLDLEEDVGTFIPCGSLMPQMKKQIDYIVEKGDAVNLTLNSEILFTSKQYKAEIERVSQQCIQLLKKGTNVILRTPYSSERIKATRENGYKYMRLNEVESSERVSEALAEISYNVVNELNLKKIITCGGNTSNAICKKLGIHGVCIVDEIDQGVSSCISLNEKPIFLILKSGSFGKEDFLQQSLQYLEQCQRGV
ncbi:four-carbon acid sugar kinase family protein [Peribacillus muralis]|uniref:four-carbon acid sugar kinase family protein n=1 Tax=Peribacillus muralis TaxID=264697 RepID=UPI0007105B7B|nr:four-carbon acid sugar kinase family protein [Peribacillus muralis]